MRRAVFVFIPLIVFASCASVPTQHVIPPLDDEGVVLLYLKPFPQEASVITFRLNGVFAVRDNGQEIPLWLRLPELKGMEMTRQRLLCEGTLPGGAYRGFSFKVAKASVAGEEGPVDLLLQEKSFPIDFAFRVAPRKAALLVASFDYTRSVADSFSFSPVITVFPAPKPVTAVSGYVSNYSSYALTVFDKNQMQTVGAVALRRGAKGVAIDRRQRRIYAAVPDDAVVEVIDATTQEILNSVRLTLGDAPQSLALTNDGKTLFAVNTGSNTVSVIDLGLLIETSRISVGNGPNAILMDRAGRRAYVFNTFSNTVSIIDVSNRTVAATLSTDIAPLWGQFNAKGDRLYIIYGLSPNMTVLDPVTLAVVSQAYVGPGVRSLKVDPLTDLIYAAKSDDAEITVYDPFSLLPFDSIDAGEPPAYMTIDDEGNNLWIIGSGTGKLISVNLASKKIVSEIDVGGNPYWLTMMGER